MYFPIKKKVDLEIYRNSRPKFCGEMGGVGEVPEEPEERLPSTLKDVFLSFVNRYIFITL
jgi:hypothetical protein